MGALAHWRRQLRRRVRSLPKAGRRGTRIAITYAETVAAVRRDKEKRPDDALRLLHDAARRSPSDMRVARLRAQLLARTGQLSDAVAEASRLAMTAPSGKNVRLQRAVQGRLVETDAAWRPRVPGVRPARLAEPIPGRVLYLAKESMPHRNNGYCTRTHETLLAVRGA